MSNKAAGRAAQAMPNIEYIQAMGGTLSNNIDNIKNTGVSFTNFEVFKYFRLLREYTLNRIEWKCDQIPDEEMRLIEWFIFHFGRCAMLRPTITKGGTRLKLPEYKIFQCNFSELNMRTGRPRAITIMNTGAQVPIDTHYEEKDFTIFTDEFAFAGNAMPFYILTWEFACKLHELDLAFNANSHKLRLPFIFNNGAPQVAKDGKIKIIPNMGITISELMRSAYGRNEQFIEIPETMCGKSGLMHEPQYVNNHMLEHLEAQRTLYERFFELLGLYTNREKRGTYTVKDLQQEGDETGDYRTEVLKRTRLLCAREAVRKFGLTIQIEVI